MISRVVVSCVWLAGCAEEVQALSPDELTELASRHEAVFEAFEIGPHPDPLHDLLASAFMGQALTEAYVEHYRTLVTLADQDIGVDVLGVQHEVWEGRGMTVAASWRVRSRIRHQSHTHLRLARYRGELHVVRTAEGPRIHELLVHNLERVRAGLSTEALFEGGDPEAEGFVDPLELLELEAL